MDEANYEKNCGRHTSGPEGRVAGLYAGDESAVYPETGVGGWD